MKNFKTTLSLVAALALVTVTAAVSEASDPYSKPDQTWISISGEVVEVRPNSFELDYGESTVTVEMDDGDRDADGYKLIKGDDVTVSGVVDADLFETTTVEASSVFVDKIGTYFYASAVDDEIDPILTMYTPILHTETVVQGRVSKIDGDEFILDTSANELRIDVGEMMYDPLDDIGYQQVDVGDVVSVTGTMESGFFEGRELVAKTVTTLVDTRDSSTSSNYQ